VEGAPLILVTGATGKVGQAFIRRVLSSSDERLAGVTIRALCHNRMLEPGPRLEVVSGSIERRDVVEAATEGATHVVHLATTKETPETVFDVTVKGLFWLLEACRASPAFRRLVLVGGDAAVGHFFYPHPLPVTETQPHTAYPGCYALSKVLEEVMLEQYGLQYHFDYCCLRAPWIMEKDDFRYQLSFGEDVFGGPRWRDLVGAEQADVYLEQGAVPVMLDEDGRPVKRNFVHVEDLVDAIIPALDDPAARRQTFNVCMDAPVDYGELGAYLAESRGLPTVEIRTPYHSTWLDNAKAKHLLGWRPRYDLERLVEEAWSYERDPGDPRIVWYPG
jgi:nucleoside-diphosphate-sugar epimerase